MMEETRLEELIRISFPIGLHALNKTNGSFTDWQWVGVSHLLCYAATMEAETRAATFLWLKERSIWNGGVFDRSELTKGFLHQGRRITLLGPQGIWFPQGFQVPISITTVTAGPYHDGFDEEGFLEYSYRGTDPLHRDNIGLSEAFRTRTPLVFFYSIKPSKYVAVWPLFIIENDPAGLRIKAALDPAYGQHGLPSLGTSSTAQLTAESELGVRRYVTALTKQRLHQSAFREYVLDAYSRQCTMCRLQHEELLDAAHIIPDSEEAGEPVVQNGMSLCKIHHAAYDRNIIGVSPAFVIKVRADILHEVDGPMLRYGLQDLEGQSLVLPKRKADWPDQDRLGVRFREFSA